MKLKALLFSTVPVAAVAGGALLLAPAAEPARALPQDELIVVDIRDGLHVIQNSGGNVGLCTGPDGPFLIDDKFANNYDAIRSAVAERSEVPAQFVINTHFHGDHTGGNALFGADGALIVAHDNVRARMSKAGHNRRRNAPIPAAPPEALPAITFADGMTLHRNGHTLELLHVPNAHTDGDTVVRFTESNVVHTGDVFFNGFYPFIDGFSGGSLRGMANGVTRILEWVDDETVVIPGHGELADRADLVAYHEMLSGIADAVEALQAEGLELDAILAAKPTAPWDEAWGDGFLTPDEFLENAL